MTGLRMRREREAGREGGRWGGEEGGTVPLPLSASGRHAVTGHLGDQALVLPPVTPISVNSGPTQSDDRLHPREEDQRPSQELRIKQRL